jgi:hypothetical protein
MEAELRPMPVEDGRQVDTRADQHLSVDGIPYLIHAHGARVFLVPALQSLFVHGCLVPQASSLRNGRRWTRGSRSWTRGARRRTRGLQSRTHESECATPGSRSRTRGSESTTRESESRTRGSQSGTRGSRNWTHGSESATRGSESRTHGSESAIRGSESWTRGSELAIHGSESWTRGSELAIHGSESWTRGSGHRKSVDRRLQSHPAILLQVGEHLDGGSSCRFDFGRSLLTSPGDRRRKRRSSLAGSRIL